jgi:hypothetical protein
MSMPHRTIALVTLAFWLFTASIGVSMLTTWVARGGLRRQWATGDRFMAKVVIGHASLALTGLGVWTSYVVTGLVGLAWAATFLIAFAVGLGLSTVILLTPFPAHREDDPATAAYRRATGTAQPAAARPDPRSRPLSTEALLTALSDDVQTSRLVDDMVASALTSEEPVRPWVKRLVSLIPVAHGIGALITVLLAVLTAVSAS